MKTNHLIGDRAFYKAAFSVTIPIIIQNAITNFVGLLDNIMVGRIGTEQMTGVAVSNQLFFVYNLFIFGAISGAGIFTAQFCGSGDNKGIRATFRFKLIVCLSIALLCCAVLGFGGNQLITLFLSDDSSGDITRALYYGRMYLLVMLPGLLPYSITQAYAGTLRECGETRIPMFAGIVAVIINLFFNYVLIFGHFGAPRLGVVGAALATIFSRFAELAIVAVYTHMHTVDYPFVKGLYSSLHIPAGISSAIIRKGTPLMLNELLWALGVSVMVQCYSTRGLAVVAGLNISNTIINLFNVVFFAFGNSLAIIVGQDLGSGETEKAKLDADRLIFLSLLISLFVAAVVASLSGYFPLLYNTNTAVRTVARNLLLCSALLMPVQAVTHTTYFTVRSGGKTFITFLFDSCFVWCVAVPLAFVLSRYTNMPIISLYLCCQGVDIIKIIVGLVLVKKGIWVHNIVSDKVTGETADAAL